MGKINIYGASGHAKVVIETICSKNEQNTIQMYDDDTQKQTCLGIPVIHTFEKLDQSAKFVFGIGSNLLRKKISEKIESKIDFAPAIIHQSATISYSASIGKGTVIFAKSVINAEAKIGKHCIINTAAVVEHDCVLEDYVHISPNATLAGGVHIGVGTHIGLGVSIIQGIKIGKWCTIGAGAVVTENIPDNCTAVGIPAKPIKFH